MSNCLIQAEHIESPECQGTPERISKFSNPLVASIQVESTESVIFVLSTLFLALQSTELRFFVLWTVILTPESIESGIFVLWKCYREHRCRNIRDSAAQSRLRSSAQGLRSLLCAFPAPIYVSVSLFARYPYNQKEYGCLMKTAFRKFIVSENLISLPFEQTFRHYGK